jgi:hypothetical protein
MELKSTTFSSVQVKTDIFLKTDDRPHTGQIPIFFMKPGYTAQPVHDYNLPIHC